METRATGIDNMESKPTAEQEQQAKDRERGLTILSNSFDELIRETEPGFFKTSDFDKAMNENRQARVSPFASVNEKFVFGSSTSAFQIEGGAKYAGKEWGKSVWDEFAVMNGFFDTHGQDAVNHTSFFKEDVQMMKDMGFDAYRFSISWSRIFPDGKGRTSDLGIKFYTDLLTELERAEIKAFVTLFHWDTPLKLEEEYSGWLCPKIADDFANYAEFCFQTFGDKVDKWVTLNEPFAVVHFAYVKNIHAPGFGDNYVLSPIQPKMNCPPAFPYIVCHNLVLAHAKAVQKFREYQFLFPGNKKIGITVNSKWFEPKNPNDPKDVEAAGRALDYYFGWFLDPLVHGKYPHTVEDFIPQFSDEDKKLVQHSYDFIGINYYTAEFVTYQEKMESEYESDDKKLDSSENGIDKHGNKITIGDERGASSWLISHPMGIQKLLLHVKNNYNDPIIYITENGIDDDNLDHKCTTKQWTSLFDEKRLSYIRDHLDNVFEAMKKGVDVRGYFTWSLLDNFEWNNRFNVRFGLIYVDYHHPSRKRYLKLSSTWLKHCLLKENESHHPDPMLIEREENPSFNGEMVGKGVNMKKVKRKNQHFPWLRKKISFRFFKN